MECGRGRDGEHTAGIQRPVGRWDQGLDSRAASFVGEEVSSSSGSANASQRVSDPSDRVERHYVQAILDCYLSLPGTPNVTSRGLPHNHQRPRLAGYKLGGSV